MAGTKKFNVTAPSEQEAGVAFNVTLTATDEWGNLTTSYAGEKTLAFSEPASSPSGMRPIPTTATTVTFTAGVGTGSAIKLYDAQSTTLKVKEGAARGTSSRLHGQGSHNHQEVHRGHTRPNRQRAPPSP